ncbi:MAG: Gfo/Idh/MocA family oxidoreductase, partial [Hyphomonadaceae bacterium]|nr:Gfo/Idh/MocA family oxidoreductase [Clostridia bacterium]
MPQCIRWGIVGTGAIAKKFASAIKQVDGAELVAVASRSQTSADTFACEFDVPQTYASYEAMANDSTVDVVYIATPHPYHCENTQLFLNAKKAVLCEKPFAMNAKQAQEMIACARKNNVFLMEAMWTRTIPENMAVRALLEQGVIGEVKSLQASFGFRAQWQPEGRLFNKALGGGALLDVGIYVVSYASMIFGKPPDTISGFAQIGTTGVDEQNAMIFGYNSGQMATLLSAVRSELDNQAVIYGEKGKIVVPRFWDATSYVLCV